MAQLSRRTMVKLRGLQAGVRELAASRNKVLSIFFASRHAATTLAQRELWLEFSWADQEYRSAVRNLANFCLTIRGAESAPTESSEIHG